MRRSVLSIALAVFALASSVYAEESEKTSKLTVDTKCVQGISQITFTNEELIAPAPKELRNELSWINLLDNRNSVELLLKSKEDTDCTLGYFVMENQKKDRTQGAFLFGRLVGKPTDNKKSRIDHQLFGIFSIRATGAKTSNLNIWVNPAYADQKFVGAPLAGFIKTIKEELQKEFNTLK